MVKPVVILDATPLGILANSNPRPNVVACRRWLAGLRAAGRRVVVPEIADYEVRRELIRINSTRGLSNLDWYGQQLDYLPLTTDSMRKAAELWALARQQGQPTGPNQTLDADVILAAQTLLLGVADVVVAISNVRHLARFVAAELWQNIQP